MEHALERTQVVPVPPGEAFAFFADPWNLEAITPPWLRFRLVEAPARLERCSHLRYRLQLFGVSIHCPTGIVALAAAALVHRPAAVRPLAAVGAHAPAHEAARGLM